MLLVMLFWRIHLVMQQSIPTIQQQINDQSIPDLMFKMSTSNTNRVLRTCRVEWHQRSVIFMIPRSTYPFVSWVWHNEMSENIGNDIIRKAMARLPHQSRVIHDSLPRPLSRKMCIQVTCWFCVVLVDSTDSSYDENLRVVLLRGSSHVPFIHSFYPPIHHCWQHHCYPHSLTTILTAATVHFVVIYRYTARKQIAQSVWDHDPHACL